MYDVFLSYSRTDTIIADQIYMKLSEKGLDVFYDKQSIGAESFPKKIAQGIKESKVILFLASWNSVTAKYAPDELAYAKNHKSRNSIIVYRIDSCSLPDDIELLLSSLNYRDAAVDSIDVILDDVLQILSQGSISSIPHVTKSTNVDKSFENLLFAFNKLDYYSVIHYEIENGNWKDNWNHHLLLMRAYKFVGDRRNFGIMLNMYQTSGIEYYPDFYGVISQVWDMIEFGYINEAETHIKELLRTKKSRIENVCAEVNYTHILLLSGEHQDALNRYKDIMKVLSPKERYSYFLKDFDTLNWMGYNQLSSDLMSRICLNIGYRQRVFMTSPEGHLDCEDLENTLCSHRWHWREGRTHIILSFRSFNGTGNSIYYFVEYERSILGRLFDVLPWGMDESNTIQRSGRIFCQYRITKIKDGLFLEEYNPITDDISCGEILCLNHKELHVKIRDNGNPQMVGNVRKYKAINN